MVPLLDPDEAGVKALLWAAGAGLLPGGAGGVHVLVERLRGGALVHTNPGCAKADRTTRSETVRVPLADAVTDPGLFLGAARGRLCFSCDGMYDRSFYQVCRTASTLQARTEDLEEHAAAALQALKRLHEDADAALTGDEWEVLVTLHALCTPVFEGPLFLPAHSVESWFEKASEPFKVVRDVLAEAARSRIPMAVLDVVGTALPPEGLSVPRVYLVPPYRTSQVGCDHAEHRFCSSALSWLWGSDLLPQSASAVDGSVHSPGRRLKPQLLAVPAPLAPHVARWARMVEVGPYDEELHDDLAEVFLRLGDDAGGLRRQDEQLVAAALVLGREGFTPVRHFDEESSPEPEWLRALLAP